MVLPGLRSILLKISQPCHDGLNSMRITCYHAILLPHGFITSKAFRKPQNLFFLSIHQLRWPLKTVSFKPERISFHALIIKLFWRFSGATENTDANTNVRSISEQDVFQTLWLVVSSSLSIYQHPCKGHRVLHINVLALCFLMHAIS